jgi:hypothetical protein
MEWPPPCCAKLTFANHRRRFGAAKRIDSQLKRCWLFNRQIGGFKRRVSMIALMPP